MFSNDRRRNALLFGAVVVCVLLTKSAAFSQTDAKPDPQFDQMLVDTLYVKFKDTTGFLVGCELHGTAEQLGFDQQKTIDRMKLRLANTIANVYIFKGQGKDDPTKFAKPGLVSLSIWTVGDNYPVAYHVEITAGLFKGDSHLFSTAVLGYGNNQNVIGTVNGAVDDMIDDFAVAFHKGVGDF